MHPKRRLLKKRGIGIKILNKKPLVMLLHFLVVEEGLREPFHARDWLKTYGQRPCGTLPLALSPCGNVQLIENLFQIVRNHPVLQVPSQEP